MISDVLGFRTRDGTTDANAVYALADDEYRLTGRDLDGWAIDVGAHIGTVSISMARQNPWLRVVAVEAVPENADLLAHNIEAAGLTDRITVEHAWAGGPNDLTGTCHYGYRGGDVEATSYVEAHRFIGETWRGSRDPEFALELSAISLDALIEKYQMGEVAFLKIDCEGCEWAFLDTPAVAKLRAIVGEYHGGITGVEDAEGRLTDLLGATHELEFWNPEETVVGMFEARRR